MSTLIPGVYVGSKVRCDNCGHETTGREMRPIDNANERLFAGEEIPAGACPECGCCAFLIEEKCWAAKPRRVAMSDQQEYRNAVREVQADERYRARARQDFADDNLQIDFDAPVRPADNGAWVQAWVYVYDEEE